MHNTSKNMSSISTSQGFVICFNSFVWCLKKALGKYTRIIYCVDITCRSEPYRFSRIYLGVSKVSSQKGTAVTGVKFIKIQDYGNELFPWI